MGHDENKSTVSLRIAYESELEKFKADLQEAFRVSAEREFGHTLDKPIPSDEDVEESFRADGAIVYQILVDEKIAGGAIVLIDEVTQCNKLSLFFVLNGRHDRGIGYKAWKAIEERHPKTKVWETFTPYFEKRNIHFYVNKCGFKIVGFYNKHHPDPDHRHDGDSGEKDEMFKFEKQME